MLEDYFPRAVNSGPWVTAYTLDWLRRHPDVNFILPICSLSTPYQDCLGGEGLLLPPLYREAMPGDLKAAVLRRIFHCFPRYGGDQAHRLKIVELPKRDLAACQPGGIVAFGIDTAVEEHGPHLPLATDTIQSYSVLESLASTYQQLRIFRPLEYGQLTWGLPFGYSIDLTVDLLRPYVTNYVNAIVKWQRPAALYVVDVHGSIQHRKTIVEGLQKSDFSSWTFRWLYEPLTAFASERGDQHAGGVETALVGRANPALLDQQWWPARMEQIAEGQMSLAKAVSFAGELEAFAEYVRDHPVNGVVGDIENFLRLDADELFDRMLVMARTDVERLLGGRHSQQAGESLW